MSCFACIPSRRKDVRDYNGDLVSKPVDSSSPRAAGSGGRKGNGELNGTGSFKKVRQNSSKNGNLQARSYTYRELAVATQNFRDANLIGEGGFGSVYKGRLESGQIVAIKQLNLQGHQGNQEFIVEVLMLSLLHHPNLVTLLGYCTDGDQRLLVYEYMPMGSLEAHLFEMEPDREPLDWATRLKIAVGAARGLEYLHCKADPPVIYRDLKSSNILLDNDFNSKLSDFGLAKLGPVGDNTHVSTRVMGTYGYCAPDYAMSGRLTLKSDIYSFGVVLLELITGRRAIDLSKKEGEQNLIVWSRPFLKDKKKFIELVDPMLQGQFPVRSLHHAVAITAMCLQEQAQFRPLVGDIVVALEYLLSQAEISSKVTPIPFTPPQLPSSSPPSHQNNNSSSPLVSEDFAEDSNTAAPSIAEDSNTAAPSMAEDNTAAPSKAEDSKTAAPSTAKDFKTAAPSTAKDFKTAAPSTAEDSNTAAPSTAEDSNTAAPSKTEDSNTAAPSMAEDSKTAAPSTAEDSNTAAPSKSSPDRSLL